MTLKLVPNISKLLEQIACDEGRVGHSLFQFEVVHKKREPCPVCGSTIEQVPVQNRGACFCPTYQPFGSRPST